MFRLAHISDPHLGPLPEFRTRDLSLKQRLGSHNWKQNRVKFFDDSIRKAVIDDMKATSPDHIAVTGDLINLGLPKEIENAAAWLERLGEPADVTAVPGNHDAYVAPAVDWFMTAWQPYLQHGVDDLVFPTLHRRGPLALIGLSTAVATAPFMATGRLGADQIERLGGLLEQTRDEGLCRIILIHHPPDPNDGHWYKQLLDASGLARVLHRHGAELILHGHDHKNRLTSMPGRDGHPIPVVGVTATAMRAKNRSVGGCWNLITIDTDGDGYRIDLATRGLTNDGSIGKVREASLSPAS